MNITRPRFDNIFFNIAAGAILGLLTGFIGGALVPLWPDFDLFYIVSGGICFGMGLALWAKWRFGLGYLGVLLLIGLMPTFYYAAVFTTIIAHDQIKFGPEYVVHGVIGGGVGALFVAALIASLFASARRITTAVIVIVVGAIAGAIVLPLTFDLRPNQYGIMALQMGWQSPVMASVFAVLARGVRR